MINTKIKQTEQELINIINNCELPPAIIELILKSLLNEIKKVTNEAIKAESEREQENIEISN